MQPSHKYTTVLSKSPELVATFLIRRPLPSNSVGGCSAAAGGCSRAVPSAQEMNQRIIARHVGRGSGQARATLRRGDGSLTVAALKRCAGKPINGRVAHLVRLPTAGVEVGDTNCAGLSCWRLARSIRVPHLTGSLMRWATLPEAVTPVSRFRLNHGVPVRS